MRKSFYSAGKLLIAMSILGCGAVALDNCTAGIARAASAPLPESHPNIDMRGGAAPAAPKFDFSKIVKP